MEVPMSNEKEPEYINIPIPMRIPYAYDAGLYVSGFLQELRDNERIYANKCPECGRFLLPPRIMCGRCSVRMGEWIEQGHKGTLVSFGVTIEPQLDVTTGENKEVPFNSRNTTGWRGGDFAFLGRDRSQQTGVRDACTSSLQAQGGEAGVDNRYSAFHGNWEVKGVEKWRRN